MALWLRFPEVTRAQTFNSTLTYAASAVDNPLKGLVPYAGEHRSQFPHSMEFNYLPLSALVVGPAKYDWQPLEKLLNDIASRGHQATYRIYLEYPDKKNCIPKYLIEQGMKVSNYVYQNNTPLPPAEIETPDYKDPKLHMCLKDFIAAMGAKYDGDARIGGITAGLLGTWGEWHTYPRMDLFPGKEIQTVVMDAYQAAFHKTPVLLRYPAGPTEPNYASNHTRPFGYHDDSFAWATLETEKKGDEWFFLSLEHKAGTNAQNKWRKYPIGGEIRPEAWGKVFDEKPDNPNIQDFQTCVELTHATWMMDTGMFQGGQSTTRKKRAEEMVRRMGYDFTVKSAELTLRARSVQIKISIENRGVAPFYAAWPIELMIADRDNRSLLTFALPHTLNEISAENPSQTWTAEVPLQTPLKGSSKLLMRVANPLPNGHAVRFANTSQDADLPGWLTLITGMKIK